MPGCLYKCPNINDIDLYNAWSSVRDHYGPKPDAMNDSYRTTLYNTDLSYFVSWAADMGQNPSDPVLFGKFMNWKLSIGTNNFGNLPSRKREYVGISCIPCPYDTASSTERSTVWLGSAPVSQNSHGIYRMRVSQRGNIWGFECSFSGCPFQISNGHSYFHA